MPPFGERHEAVALGRLVGLVRTRIAVAHADQPRGAVDVEVDPLPGRGHDPALAVDHVDRDQRHVGAIGADPGAVHRQAHRRAVAGGGHGVGGDPFAALVAARHQRARLVGDAPLQVPVALQRLAAQRATVEQQLHVLGVAVDAHVDRLAFAARPVPVRQQVDHRLGGPGGLQVVAAVLQRAGRVHHPELGRHGRPAEGRGLAAVVEAGPDEHAGQEGPLGIEAPGFLDGRGRRAARSPVVGGDLHARRVVGVDAAGGVGQALLGHDHRPLREAAVHRVDVVLALVVEADHLRADRGALRLARAGRRQRRRAGRIQARHDGLHLPRQARADLGVLDRPFLVAHRPQDDGRMVAVAPHHALELVADLRRGAHHAVLVDDEDAQAVAGVQQLRRGRMVGRADGVDAHGLEHPQPRVVHGVRHRDADAGMVLVVVGAMQLDGPAVEEEALVGVEADRADAEGRVVAIDDPAIAAHPRRQGVALRRLQRPQPRHGHAQRRAARDRGIGGHLARRHPGARDDAAVRIAQFMLQRERGRGLAVVAHRGVDGDLGPLSLDGRAHEGAPVVHMQRVGLGEPDMAIEARTLVPPALLRGGVHPHGDDIAAAVVQVVGEVHPEARVAAGLAPQVVPVDPDDAVAEDAVELQRDAPTLRRRRDGQLAPVPADAVLGERAADRLRAMGRAAALAERQFHRPVVRQVDAAPRPVVEVRRGGPVAEAGLGEEEGPRAVVEVLGRVPGVAQREAPAVIDAHALPDVVGRGGAGDHEHRQREQPGGEQ